MTKPPAHCRLRRLAAGLAFAALAWAGPAGAAGLTIAGCENYAPYSDAALPGNGFANDLTAQILNRAGYATTITMVPWMRALDGTESGAFDIIPSVWFTADRSQKLLFSEPIARSRLVFVKRTGERFEYRSLEDLAGLRVGTISGYAYVPDFMTATTFQRLPTADILSNLRRVATGHLDVTLDDELTLRFILRSRAPELAPLLTFTDGVLAEQGLFVGFSRRRPDAARLVAAFNAGLARMRADGSYQRLLVLHQMQ